MYVHDRIVSGIGWDGVLHLMIDWKSALQKSGKSALRKLPSQLHDNRLEKVFDIMWPQFLILSIVFFPEREHQRVNSYELTLAKGEKGTDTRHTTYITSKY